jgi:hypothetical protein
MKIAFQTPVMDVRGTCVSLYDYAHYNETILRNRSIILTPINGARDATINMKFSKRFEVFLYESQEDLDNILEREQCDIMYGITYGKRTDSTISSKVKSVVHCVFDLSDPHGDAYAGVSETLARKYNYPFFVPHMIGLRPSRTRDSLRKELNIAEDAIVFGRHGGSDTFDLEHAKSAIRRVVRIDPKRFFIFVNTPSFDDHPQVIFLDKIVDMDEKNRFICTCDAMIHAQSLGETFGLSIGEFSVNNKPIICYGGSVWNDNYKVILGDRAIYYLDENSCYTNLLTFDSVEYQVRDNNCYRNFSPEAVMKKFEEVFITPFGITRG